MPSTSTTTTAVTASTATVQPLHATHRVVAIPLDRLGTSRVIDRETGQEWLARTRTPLFSTARLLLDLGANAADRLEVCREGRDRPDMLGRIGALAKLTVVETESKGPTLAPFRAFDRERLAADQCRDHRAAVA
jgi:hypothetical protein